MSRYFVTGDRAMTKASEAAAGIIALAVLSGCEEAEIVGSKDEGLYATSRSCTHTGYCYTMMPGFDGKMKPQFKLSPYCPGTKSVVVRVYTDTMQYPSKPNETFTQRREVWVRDTSPCA